MPKVFLNENQRLCTRLSRWIYGEMKRQRISQRVMAEEMEITQQALSYKLKVQQFSFSDFVTIVSVLDPDPSELAWLLGRKGSI